MAQGVNHMITLRLHKDREWDEYQVQYRVDGVIDEGKTYHTDDRQDAIGTMKLMQAEIDAMSPVHEAILRYSTQRPTELVKVNPHTLDFIGTVSKPEDITNYFKRYMPLDKGNSKLGQKGIVSFSLLPVVTCSQHCKKCYDVKSLRYKSVRAKRIINTILAFSHREYLEGLIIGQLKRARTIKAVRIHVGGDFFNQDYFRMWARIAATFPEVKFYTYSKNYWVFDETIPSNMNIVQSTLPDGSFNFAALPELKEKKSQFGGIICPATMGKKTTCNKCQACMKRSDVLFVLH
ncbi:hypothetical protein ACFL6N_04195 [Thermodesulfobacteriota bacterium]